MIPDERCNEFPCELLREFFVDWFDHFSAVLHRFFISVITIGFELLIFVDLVFDCEDPALPTQTNEGEHDDEVMLKIAPP